MRRSPLKRFLTDATPMFAVPTIVLRQLIGYYADWRRSRDILSDPDELIAHRSTLRVPETMRPSGMRSLRAR